MKKVLEFIVYVIFSPLITLVYRWQFVVFVVVLSAFFTLCKWLFSLMSICNAPTWKDFVFGGLALFIIPYVYFIIKGICGKYLMLKYGDDMNDE